MDAIKRILEEAEADNVEDIYYDETNNAWVMKFKEVFTPLYFKDFKRVLEYLKFYDS